MAAYRSTARTPEAPVAVVRAAIYTRKSTSAGLEQEFNSLDAQRESCEGNIKSQAHLGWRALHESYDDGGFTGANIERPAFQRLLADVEAGRIDVVVVYKVDRLSRSLLDFAGVMDRFHRHGVAFVSVTQNFSTANAMGHLTLNMLMSLHAEEPPLRRAYRLGRRTARGRARGIGPARDVGAGPDAARRLARRFQARGADPEPGLPAGRPSAMRVVRGRTDAGDGPGTREAVPLLPMRNAGQTGARRLSCAAPACPGPGGLRGGPDPRGHDRARGEDAGGGRGGGNPSQAGQRTRGPGGRAPGPADADRRCGRREGPAGPDPPADPERGVARRGVAAGVAG